MNAVDSRVRIITLLAQQRPEAVVGIAESEWVDFKTPGPEGPYDLRQEAKKFELAKDVAAFANTGGGLIVCGFKATRRPTDLYEAVVKRTPFDKRLVKTETYKAVIAEYVHPPISIDFSWYEDPEKAPFGYLVIEVPALAESDRWALVTRTLSEEGRLVKGGVAIPFRHGDDTRYLSPEELYQLVNSGLRGGPEMDVELNVTAGTAVAVTVAETVLEALLARRRRELLSSLPEREQRPRQRREDRTLSNSEQRLAEEFTRLRDITQAAIPRTFTSDLRTPQQYRQEVDDYLKNNRPWLTEVLNWAAALQRDPLVLRLENRSDAMLREVEVIATLDPGYRQARQRTGSLTDLNALPWPEPPVSYGSKNPLASMGMSEGISSLGLYTARHSPRGLRPRAPEWTRSQDGLVIKFPPVDLRPHASFQMDPIRLYGQPAADSATVLRWTATCTNLDGRQERRLHIPVEELSLTLPPDAHTAELIPE